MPQYTNVNLVGATKSTLNITTPTLIKASAGALFHVDVTVAGTSSGTANDANSIANSGTANVIINFGSLASAAGFSAGFPFNNGLVINPGTGETIAVAYR